MTNLPEPQSTGVPPDWVGATLDYCYDMALNSTLGGAQKSCFELAEEYRRQGLSADRAVENLIAWQCGKTAVSGFATGLPGLLALPVALPLDLASLWYVQLRMVATIAIIQGLDPKDDRVRSLCFASLLGGGAQEALSRTGALIATKGAEAAIRRIPRSMIVAVNRTVGFRLVTKFGTKGALNLVRLVPVAGGIAGGAANAIGTRIVGKVAAKLFRAVRLEDEEAAMPISGSASLPPSAP